MRWKHLYDTGKNRVRELRLKHKLTQQELANNAKINRVSLARIENGTRT